MKLCLFVTLSLCILYLILPNPPFPSPPPGALQSSEPSDTESVLRRAYFTNLSRDEIVAYYKQTFNAPYYFSVRLNHPPEFAYALIRDQTRSSFLEEIVHPFRESLYVNGFTPTDPRDQINRNGVHYATRITVKYVPSSQLVRLTALLLTLIAIYWLIKESFTHAAKTNY